MRQNIYASMHTLFFDLHVSESRMQAYILKEYHDLNHILPSGNPMLPQPLSVTYH